jgi:uncharacterized coiled-coil protein SlyX
MRTLAGWSAVLCLGAGVLQAQEHSPLESLEESIGQLRQIIQRQQQQIDELNRELKSRQPTGPAVPPAAPPLPDARPPEEGPVTRDELEDLQSRVESLAERAKQAPKSLFNPAIGFVGEALFSYNSRANSATGFDRPGGWDAYLRSAELNLESTVDPFVRGYAVLNASANASTGDASVHVEEAVVITRSLPWNLTARGGRFFAEFGRLSYKHEHDLPFVLRPLALDSLVFGESQTDGLELNWLVPSRHYVSLTAGTGIKFGNLQSDANAFRSTGDLSSWVRASTFFDLTPNLNLELGTSGMLASDQDLDLQGDGRVIQRERQLAGVDFTLRYQPLASNQYRGLEWGTEYLVGRGEFDYDPDALSGSGDEFSRRPTAHGLYSYLAWKFSREWSAGFLFDWTQTPELPETETYRYSPFLTWRPSPFQMLRLQYSYTRPDAGTGYEDDHGVYLQWTWILGSHAHGFRQR